MSANTNAPAAIKPKNGLLVKFRSWHRWAGVIAALFLIIFSLTGMVLNYKKPVLTALGLEPQPAFEQKQPGKPADGKQEPAAAQSTARHAGNMLEQTVSLTQALALVREQWGEAPLERVELKMEQGEWLYKIKRKGGAELWVSAETGATFTKGEYEKVRRQAGSAPVKTFDWGKFLLDLHTGKIGGPVGVAIMTVMGGMLFFLTISGMYLWLKPILIRRAQAAARATTTATMSSSPPATNVRPSADAKPLPDAAPAGKV